MKLLLCDDKKIKTYSLTNSLEDSVVIDYFYNDSDIYETISFSCTTGVWKIVETPNIKVVSNIKDSYKEYDSIKIKLLSLDINIMIYFLPFVEEYTDYIITDGQSITIGSNANNNIVLRNYDDALDYAQITKEGNDYKINSLNNSKIYINDFVQENPIIKMGDVIFINGLKMIWMDTFIKISTYNGSVTINGMAASSPQQIDMNYTLPTEYERNLKLYADNQVFFHTPRMQVSIEEEKIKLDAPPSDETVERMPVILTIGTSSMVCITSCVTAINAIHNMSYSETRASGILDFIVSLAMIATCIMIPIFTNKIQVNRDKKKKKLRIEKYTKYLNSKKEKINEIIKKQETVLIDNNLSLEEIHKRIVNGGSNIWIREVIDDDFLDVRLGTGEIPAKIEVEAPTKQFYLEDDELLDNVYALAESKRNLKDVPIVISMSKNKIVSYIMNTTFKQEYIDSIMLQIMYYYSPNDLKLVIFTTEDNKLHWNYTKYLPHLWSAKRDKRFFATTDNESIQLSSYLDQIYERRLESSTTKNEEEKKNSDDKKSLYKNYDEYYLIITDNFGEVKNIPIINRLLNSNVNIGFSLMVLGNDIKQLPSKLDRFVDVRNGTGGVYSKNLKNSDKSSFKLEFIQNIKIDYYAKAIANIPVESQSAGYNLPASLTFMDLYHAGKISHLNITKKWQENDPTISLFAPIGIKDNGKVIGLDLHEKVHGPHGLIAGSTGSGKSEFIITYILSMAINYSPKEVQFILIDYKGGGLAGAFENRAKGIKIPHLVGTITNLDTSEMNRTLVSLQSELKRRQRKFNEARELLSEGTIDIYKYQKMYREGKLKDPMSHLFVICDEFAELKQQQPDFMAELISTSRIGRSLGVHLILATQKPSGVVDDQIWSNARFKVCLKVQTESDSNEMIKRNDAAYIKEAGRFYFQVGNNELFEYGQSAWSGAKYIPVEHVRNKVDDSIDFLSNDGTIIKTINDDIKIEESENNNQEQLVSIVNYLYELGVKEKYDFSSLWLPSLPKTIYMSNLIKKYNYKAEASVIAPLIGEYDKPAKQEQGLFSLNINSSNTVIFGIPNSGKENVISNIIYTSCLFHSPQEVNFYIIDFGSGALSPYQKFPHVGDIITISNKEKTMAEFEFLDRQIKLRKDLFSEYGGNYNSYIKNSGVKIPLIVTIINSFESFGENCYDTLDTLNSLLREGSKYGIVFVVSAISTSSIRSTVLEYYANRVLLQSNDDFDYHYILGAPSGFVPSKYFGRGIVELAEDFCEFQTAIIADDSRLNEMIKTAGNNMYEYYKTKVSPIRIMPEHILLNSMFKYAKQINKIPIGYTRDEIDLYYYNFITSKSTSIIGNNVTNDISFMCSIIDLIDSIGNIKMNIFDFITCVSTDGKASYYNISFTEPFTEMLKNEETVPTINVIIGLGNCYDVLNEGEKELFDNIMTNMEKLQNQYFIIFDNNDRYSKVMDEEWFKSIDRNYIWVGKYIDSQNIFDISHISNNDVDETMEDLVYVVEKEKYYVLKGVGGSE